MKTVIAIEDSLHRRARAYAARHRTTLTALVNEALRARLAVKGAARRPPVELPTFRGTGLQPGVDLDDTSSLLDRMDGVGDRS